MAIRIQQMLCDRTPAHQVLLQILLSAAHGKFIAEFRCQLLHIRGRHHQVKPGGKTVHTHFNLNNNGDVLRRAYLQQMGVRFQPRKRGLHFNITIPGIIN